MPQYRDNKKNSWYCSFYFREEGTNKSIRKIKRGFSTKASAKAWEIQFLNQKESRVEIKFEDFLRIYYRDMEIRLKLNSYMTKKNILDTKVLPFFKGMIISEISTDDIIRWQNSMMTHQNGNGKKYSVVYLKTVHNQLSAVLNYACKTRGLKDNVAKLAGNMGKAKGDPIKYWTVESYQKFLIEILDKPITYYCFQLLFFCGIRVGELLALELRDFDFEKKMLTVERSYQRLQKVDVITAPKTDTSCRIITLPDFLASEIFEYVQTLYLPDANTRLFQVSKYYLRNEMQRGCRKAGLEPIKLHSLRHSHISLLFDMGFSVHAISQRSGHDNVGMTYQYGHLYLSHQKEIANRLNQTWEQKK